jgi:hypothetical protein
MITKKKSYGGLYFWIGKKIHAHYILQIPTNFKNNRFLKFFRFRMKIF